MQFIYATATAALTLATYAIWLLTGDKFATMAACVIVIIVFLVLCRSLNQCAVWKAKLQKMERQKSKVLSRSALLRKLAAKSSA